MQILCLDSKFLRRFSRYYFQTHKPGVFFVVAKPPLTQTNNWKLRGKSWLNPLKGLQFKDLLPRLGSSDQYDQTLNKTF
jgi:hypothetical protein